MDVTPGPQLRRQITHSDQRLQEFRGEHSLWLTNDDLPAPDFMTWALEFSAILDSLLKLVRA